MIPINYVAVLAAAVANMVIGFLWYGPLFGKQWRHMMHFTQEDMAAAKKKGMTNTYLALFLSSLVMAYVLAHALIFAESYLRSSGAPTGVAAGLTAGFWNWLGFIAPVLLGTVLWEGKPIKLYALNVLYYLVALCVMGVILAVWM